MTRFKLLGAVAIVSALIASPASAQHMIEEPGMFAFVHPDGDLGIGSTRLAPEAHAQIQAPAAHHESPAVGAAAKSPLAKALRVRSASRTILLTMSRLLL